MRPQLEEEHVSVVREARDSVSEENGLTHVAPPVPGIEPAAVDPVGGDDGHHRYPSRLRPERGKRLDELVAGSRPSSCCGTERRPAASGRRRAAPGGMPRSRQALRRPPRTSRRPAHSPPPARPRPQSARRRPRLHRGPRPRRASCPGRSRVPGGGRDGGRPVLLRRGRGHRRHTRPRSRPHCARRPRRGRFPTRATEPRARPGSRSW